MITRKMNDSTYQVDHGPSGVTAVIGDEKQKNFYPRVKVKKWSNECNYSFGLLDVDGQYNESDDIIEYKGDGIRAKFYPKRSPVKKAPTTLRWLNMDILDPYEAAAEYELQRSLGHFEFSIATYRVKDPSIMVFGLYTGDRYLEIDKNCKAKRFTAKYGGGSHESIPVVRVPLAQTNPYFMDQGLVNIDIHLGHQRLHNVREIWVNSVIDVLKAHGIKAYRIKNNNKKGALKVYVKHKGKDVKIHSADLSFDILSAYLNFECDYNRVYDYYSPKAWPDVSADIRDDYAYGLKDVYPQASYSIVDDIVKLFAKRCHTSLDERPYNTKEQRRLQKLTKIHKNYDWVEKALRDDPGWHYQPLEDGHEFEIWLDKPPASNEVKLTMRHKNVEFHYQPALSEDDKNRNCIRWSHVEGSWAVYHADRSSVRGRDDYRVGKVGHIYRPWAEDATGERVWCDLTIDATNNIATITLPKEFLAQAVYPVMIDPLLGYQDVGASSVNFADAYQAHLVFNRAPGYTGTISGITAYVDMYANNSSTLQWKWGIYRNSDGAKIYETVNQTGLDVYVSGWTTYASSTVSPPALAVGLNYQVGVWASALGGYESANIYYDTMTGAGRQKLLAYSNPWPANINTGSAPTTTNTELSIYVNLNAGGESPKLEPMRVTRPW